MGGRERGSPPPKKKFTKKMFAKNFPEGRQGVLEGGGRRGGSPPLTPKQVFTPKICFAKKSPEGATAVAGRQGVLKGGRNGGEVFPTFKKTGREAPHNNLVI